MFSCSIKLVYLRSYITGGSILKVNKKRGFGYISKFIFVDEEYMNMCMVYDIVLMASVFAEGAYPML